MSIISTILFFIVKSCFYIAMLPLVLRIMFELGNAPKNNQAVQVVYKLTEKAVRTLRPKLQRIGRIDLAVLVVWLSTDLVKCVFITVFLGRSELSTIQYLLLVPADLIMQITSIIFYAITFYYLLRLVAPGLPHPIMGALSALSQPSCRLIRRHISPVYGFDAAPLLVIVLLLLSHLIIQRIIPPYYFF